MALVPKRNGKFGSSILLWCGIFLTFFDFHVIFRDFSLRKVCSKIGTASGRLHKSHLSVNTHNSVLTLPLAIDVISITDTWSWRRPRCSVLWPMSSYKEIVHSPAHRRTPAQDRFHKHNSRRSILRRTGGHWRRADFTGYNSRRRQGTSC